MFRRILVPLDGSALAERAITPALNIAQRFNGHITLVRVVEQRGLTTEPPIAPPVSLLEAQKQSRGEFALANAYLSAVATRLEMDGFTAVDTLTVHGKPATELVAQANNHDLVVMSTRGRGGLSRMIGGSVAATVIREANLPVLLLTDRQPMPLQHSFQSVLVPLDGTMPSEQALPLAAAMVAPGGELLILHISNPSSPLSSLPWDEAFGYDHAEASEEGPTHRYIDNLPTHLLPADLHWRAINATGKPAEAILSYTEAVDLVVMTTRARNGIDILLGGSVTEQVSSNSPVPVLALRQQPLTKEWQAERSGVGSEYEREYERELSGRVGQARTTTPISREYERDRPTTRERERERELMTLD